MSHMTSSIDIEDEIVDNKFFDISRPSFLWRKFSDVSEISSASKFLGEWSPALSS